jgi:signal transduction histidine kinase
MATRILIVDDNDDDIELCQRALAASGHEYDIERVASGDACIAWLDQAKADCILLDYSLPGENGLALLKRIRMRHAHLPVIVLTGQGSESIAASMMKAGAEDYVIKSTIDSKTLHQAIVNAQKRSSMGSETYSIYMPSPLILIVDDNPDDRERNIRHLKKIKQAEYRYVEADGYDSMMVELKRMKPDCVLLDYSLPGRNGLDIVRDIVPQHPHLPIIMMTGQGNESIAAQSIKEGAQHYLVKSEVTEESLHTHITSAIKHCAMERERNDLVQKLMESNIALERFAYVASHDLQEPIRMINNFGKILLAEYQNTFDNDGKEYLSMVTESGERMRDVVNDLLDYSRIGNEVVHMHTFSAQQALDSALDNLKTLIEERNALITHDALPELHGNPVQIMRLLQNLITNAIKYQKQGNRPCIHVGCEDAGERWKIYVKDNGVGIDQKSLEKVFEPFRRLHTWDTVKGSGLGLAICKKIAEQNGGELTVTSTVGEGSIFTLTLPKQAAMKEAV